jgi:hypothetical protein
MQKNTIDILSSQYPSQKIRIKYTPIGKQKVTVTKETIKLNIHNRMA